MAHLAHEDSHAGTLVIKVEIERHLVSPAVQGLDIFLYLIPRDEKFLQLPLYAHEEHTVFSIHVLVQIDDVSLVVCNELGHFRDDARLVRAV